MAAHPDRPRRAAALWTSAARRAVGLQLACLGLLLGAAPVMAQTEVAPVTILGKIGAPDGRMVRGTQTTGLQDAAGRPVPAWALGAGARFFSAIGPSAAIQIGRVRDNGRGNTRGFVLSAELGQGGQEYFLGYRRAGPLLNAVSFGVAHIRTDDDAHGLAGDQSYLGPEFRLTFLGVGVSLGKYWRTSGSAPGDGSFFDAALMVGVW